MCDYSHVDAADPTPITVTSSETTLKKASRKKSGLSWPELEENCQKTHKKTLIGDFSQFELSLFPCERVVRQTAVLLYDTVYVACAITCVFTPQKSDSAISISERVKTTTVPLQKLPPFQLPLTHPFPSAPFGRPIGAGPNKVGGGIMGWDEAFFRGRRPKTLS